MRNNFAAVLDAVAERRVAEAERMRGQTQVPTVTSTQPEPRRFADVRPDQHGAPTVTGRVAGAAGTVQPQGFRADLWRRICRHFTGREICNVVSFEQIVSLNDTACHFT